MKFPEFMAKMLIPFFMTFILGLFGGGFLTSQFIDSEPPVMECSEPLKMPVPQCPNVSSSETQLQQAKQYYEKAFSLFLAAIGAKLTSSEKSALQQLISDPKKYLERDPEINNKAENKKQSGDEKDKRPRKTDFQTQQAIIRNRELGMSELKESASKIQLKDPSLYYARSVFIKEWGPQLQAINGSFYGKLYRFDKQQPEIEEVEIHVNFGLSSENKVDGEFQLLISRAGEVYSNNSGSGGNGDIRIHPDDPTTIIFEASPNSFFHGKVNDLSVLNYYYDGKHVGVAQIGSD